MLLKVFTLSTVLAAVSLGHVLPTKGRPTDTTEDTRKTDDAWQRVDLRFPVSIYDQSSTTLWFSMNGLMCLNNPKGLGPSVPPRPFPFDPSKCPGSGCIPDYCLAFLWDDFYLPRGTAAYGDYQVFYIYHEPEYVAPANIGHHYHFYYDICYKKRSPGGADPYPATCAPGSTVGITLNIYEKQPGRFHISYRGMEDSAPGIIGFQSFYGLNPPKYLQTHKPANFPNNNGTKLACLIVDTEANYIALPGTAKDC
ncbi:hypothetical protein ABW21_db0204555 [Orbilia brochopaga]|nr:hypothetical protein ABW21_db0204555 [Drechslerella brochopaga]